MVDDQLSVDTAIVQRLQARFPTLANGTAEEVLVRAVSALFHAADQLRPIRLANADEPAVAFQPSRREA
jgi:hypothetical protein